MATKGSKRNVSKKSANKRRAKRVAKTAPAKKPAKKTALTIPLVKKAAKPALKRKAVAVEAAVERKRLVFSRHPDSTCLHIKVKDRDTGDTLLDGMESSASRPLAKGEELRVGTTVQGAMGSRGVVAVKYGDPDPYRLTVQDATGTFAPNTITAAWE